jgi:DNA-directed RNA polymerase specialized sigma24 family protein
MSDESITEWIDQLRDGDETAAQKIWERYFAKMVSYARRKLEGSPRRAADEEDVALSAFLSFYQRCSAGQFPQLADRDSLWKLLFTITERKALKVQKHDSRQKRGGGKVVDYSCFDDSQGSSLDHCVGGVVAREPSPAFAALMADEVRALLDDLSDRSLTRVAVLKLEGHTVMEIAG